MPRSEADVVCQYPQLGEEIYKAWTQSMDVSNPDDFDTSEFVSELADKYKVELGILDLLFEYIRQMIVHYNELIALA
jgi:hypothetical protein